MATSKEKLQLEIIAKVDKFTKDVKKGTKATDDLEKSMKGAAKSSNNMRISTSGLRRSVGALRNNLLLVSFAAAGVAVAFNFALQAARFKDIEKGFKNLAASARISSDAMLAAMKKATRGTISEMELMTQFSTASLLGLPLDRFDEILAIARGAARATGQTMQFMLQSIVTGLGRGSKLMLDNLGILIDVGAAQRKYADQLGVTALQLTDVQKKQAFVNEALRIGTDNLARIGDEGAAATDVFGEFSAAASELATTLGGVLLPIISNQVRDFTAIFKSLAGLFEVPETSLRDLARQISNNQQLLRVLDGSTSRMSHSTLQLRIETNKLAEQYKEAFEEQKKQAGFFEETGKLSVPAMTKSMKELVRETAEWLDLVTVTAQKLPDLSAKMKETEDRIGALTKAAGVGPDAEKEREREREELQKKRIQTAQIVSDSMGQISDAFAEAEIAKANRVADRQRALAIRGVNQRINAIKKANTVGGKLTKRGLDLIEQAETEHQLSLGRINEKARAAESEALRKQKPSRIAEAVVNTAIAVTRALTIGPVLGPIAAAAIGAAGAAQIALIADQKFQRGGFSSGGAALVGEAGPELVNLPPGSKVFNNQQTNSIVNNGGGTTVQVILDGELIAEQLVRGSELGQNRLAIND